MLEPRVGRAGCGVDIAFSRGHVFSTVTVYLVTLVTALICMYVSGLIGALRLGVPESSTPERSRRGGSFP